MSTEDPGNDPFRKRPRDDEEQAAGATGPQRPEEPEGPRQPPYGTPPPGTPPHGAAEPPPQGGGAPYGSPYGSPYGDPYGGTAPGPGRYGPGGDPLAGMPPLASRGKRLLARIVDALIIGIPVAIVSGFGTGFDYEDTGAQWWPGGLYTLVYFVYEGLMLSHSGQTLGKRLLRVRVAMLLNGSVPAGSPAWIRAVVYHVPALVPCIGTLFWLVNVLFCTWDRPYRQCLHDKAGKTVVVATD
ncbi:RDD family protein [Streptomyces sp. JJ36]|uniref:RDD family protein n=1 Tax=Streptomyces sp. JJ36 TaxID=2736645 RepID=UPI001F2FB22F|nr:RDD family protein [Streptomyces sp. JJ36]MCF6525590.1 RDD family protein [Streptomyces sp. JJ36]